MPPLVSLVIASYNREHYLGKAIDSILNQTFSNFELLVWDDGSTDRSLEIAHSYAQRDERIRVIAAPHQGIAPVRQAAIAQTQGDYIGWVDSDDWLAPTALAETVAVLQAEPETGMVYTDYLDIDESGMAIGYGSRCQIPYSPERLLVDFMTFHFRLIRRQAFDRAGGIDPSFSYGYDYDLCLRLSEVTQVRRVKKSLYYYRNHAQSRLTQAEQAHIQSAQRAIEAALKRRRLTDRYHLQVTPAGQFVLQRKPISLSLSAYHRCAAFAAPLLLALPVGFAPPAQAQITPATDGTGTIVTPTGTTFNITGGTQAGANLFQSFQQFGLTPGQTAIFLSNPAIQNILGRVVGGSPSVINGLIRVTGSNANLFLINPAGIVFGANASLNVPGSFTATTATGIGFGNSWFNATGNVDYASLVGSPTSVIFNTSQPGAIVNAGNLAVGQGQSLSLIGGTILSSGQLSAPGGEVNLLAVPGSSLVRLSQPGTLLGFEFTPPTAPAPVAPTLAQLITGGNLTNASGISLNPDGSVRLSGSGAVQNGDVVAAQISAGSTRLAAANNVIVAPVNPTTATATLQTSGDLNLLAGNTVFLRDSRSQPLRVQAGGDLTIRGTQGVDILALNFLPLPAAAGGGTPIQSGGNTTLVSNGQISTDTHFTAGGSFSTRTLAGGVASFLSLYDPIFTVGGDFAVGDYVGASLQVNAGGNITYGNVVINAIDPLIDPLNPAFLLTAGGNITGFGNVSTTLFTSGLRVEFQAGGNVTTQLITTTGGNVRISGNSLTLGTINTTPGIFLPGNGGDITLSAIGNINANDLIGNGYGFEPTPRGGIINVTSQTGSITAGNISATGTTFGAFTSGGSVSLTTLSNGGNIRFNSIDVRAVGTEIVTGGDVFISARGLVQGTGILPIPRTTATTIATSPGGRVSITHDGGPDNLSFTVGPNLPPAGNGLVGDIDTGADIASDQTFAFTPFPAISPNNSIEITFSNTAPTLTATPSLTGAIVNRPFNFTFAQLNPVRADVNADNPAVIRVVSIAPGARLRINGVLVEPGSILKPGDRLQFIPPPRFIGTLSDAIVLSATDGLETVTRGVAINVRGVTVRPPCFPNCGSSGDGNPTGGGTVIVTTPDTPDDQLADEYNSYLGRSSVRIKTIDEQRDILQEIERETGVKPAIIYVSFVPELFRFGSANDEAQSDQLELLVITANGKPIRKRIPTATRAVVLAIAQKFRNEVSDPRKTRSTSYLKPAQQLYQWIIAPIASDLKTQEINNLVFLMEAGLRSIPIAALHSGQSFLAEQYSVGVMPSFSLTDTRYRDIRDVKVLGMGISESTQQQPPLPAVPVEVSTLVKEIWSGKEALNNDVTLNNLIAFRQQQPFGIIHLATHADFQSGAIGNSYIQLWDDKLRLDQVRQLGWNNPQIELLVLSACATALGDREAELGFGGLAVQTGVKSALASLWYVSDAATTALMTDFYQNLRTSRIKAEALRQAQLALIKGLITVEGGRLQGRGGKVDIQLPAASASLRDRQLSHPYYWSAFTMIGSPW